MNQEYMRNNRAWSESRLAALPKVMAGSNGVINDDQRYREQERSIVRRHDASGSAVHVVTEAPNELDGVSSSKREHQAEAGEDDEKNH
jgi:hypothetical protein